MQDFKKTFLFLFSIIFSGIVVLGIITLRYDRVFTSPDGRNAFKNTAILLLAGIFLLLGVLFFLLLYNFNRRKKAEKKLRESEDRFRLLIRDVKDYAIFMVDPDGRVMSWNEGAAHIKGYTEEEVIGKPISIFYTDEENLRGEPAYNLQRAVQDGRFESRGWRKRKDGTLFYADVVFTALYDDKHNLRGFAKITRDVTGQKKAEEEIGNALKREKELNEMKSRFVTLASHEFKTPLSVILSSTSLIAKYQGTEMEEKKMKHIHRIKSNVNNLKQLLDDFLSIEKLEAGIIRNNPQKIDLPGFVGETIQEMTEECKPGQKIVLEMEGDRQTVFLDGHLLRNVLNNLLSNAIKYSPADSEIQVTVRSDAGQLAFTVRDKGIGIPPAEQEHLFQRFFRASNTTGIAGTGIGLSIVKKYLDLMGGGIHFRNVPDGGTEFTVVLPPEPFHEYIPA